MGGLYSLDTKMLFEVRAAGHEVPLKAPHFTTNWVILPRVFLANSTVSSPSGFNSNCTTSTTQN